MRNRKLLFALVTVTPEGEQTVIRRAANREKLEQEREKLRQWNDQTLMIVDFEKSPDQIRKSDELGSILDAMNMLKENGDKETAHLTADELLCQALKLIAGKRHSETVGLIIDAWDEVEKWYA